MTLQQRIEARRLARRRSQLVPWGGLLIALGLFVPIPLTSAARQMSGAARGLGLIATDLFRLGFFIGVALLIIGSLRNRRWKRQAKAAEQAALQP